MRTRLRRYPALGFLAAAALLASLLPSALRVPLSGPSSSAELAPVPGRSDAIQGDLSALGQSSTAGLGSGAGVGGDGPGGGSGRGGPGAAPEIEQPPPPDRGSGRNPANKRCVGRPLRQTEDSWSPPCVAYFKGDNFGATSPGVTRDEIRIVEFSSCNSDGTIAIREYGNGADSKPSMLRFFNERFQTYERRVRLFFVDAPEPRSGTCNEAAAMRRIKDEIDPFYVFFTRTTPPQPEAAREAPRLGMMVHVERTSRSFAQLHAPKVVSFSPDLEDWTANVTEALCARLAGRQARYAGDPTMWGQRRKFGLIYQNSRDRDGAGADMIVDGVRRRCGDAAGEIVVGTRTTLPNFTTETARLAAEGVTTVIGWGLEFGMRMREAEAAKWYPEWFAVDDFYVDFGAVGMAIQPPAQAANVFGLMSTRRHGAPAERHDVRAWAEGCACSPQSDGHFAMPLFYNSLLLLFTGIQAAGPRLTPASFDKGLHALPARRSGDPFTPAAYFAPGNHSFVKDFAFIWWDPSGTPPGGRPGGCYRLVEDGARYRAEDWVSRPGDDGIKDRNADQPCQGNL